MPCVDIDSVSNDALNYLPVDKTNYKRHIGHPVGGVGTPILHAVTGAPTGINAGSYGSLGLYIVSDLTGRYDSRGFVIDKLRDPMNPDPVRFAYHSPYEYARHMRVSTDTPEFRRTIARWKDIQSYIMVNGVVDPERWKEWKSDNNY
jgi:hypothetical protein